jgi:hypothetical protein
MRGYQMLLSKLRPLLEPQQARKALFTASSNLGADSGGGGGLLSRLGLPFVTSPGV